MINLHAAVRGVITAVNPDIMGTLLVSTGSVKKADYSRAPAYAPPVLLPMQIQPLSMKEVQHLDSLNIQGVERSIYINGLVEGMNRPSGKGGDLITFANDTSIPVALRNSTWKVAVVFESWDAPGWCKVGVQKQLTPVENNA